MNTPNFRRPIALPLLGLLAAACMRPPPASDDAMVPSHAEWELTFSEEFDREGVDPEVWESQAGPRGGDKPEGRWPENNLVKDGILYQATKRESPPRGGKKWSSAHIWTRAFTQRYGFFAARLRYGRYLNNAFWLYRPRGQRFAERPHFEIDINEGHTPREVAMTLHFIHYLDATGPGHRVATSKRWDAPVDLDAGFHIYACEWDEREIIWYFDGQPVRRVANPGCTAPADVRLSTVIMEHQLARDGTDIATMDGVSMAVDWVRVYRKRRDLHPRPAALELEHLKLPKVVERPRQIPPAKAKRVVLSEDFEATAVGALPTGWEVGDRTPSAAPLPLPDRHKPLTPGKRVLKLESGDYAFVPLPQPVAGRLEVAFDTFTNERREGLLFVTLGAFDKADPEARALSYHTGDIGPYIHWNGPFIHYYTQQDKWTPFARRRPGAWRRVRFVLDVSKGVFDCHGGADAAEFRGGGVFRHRQKAARGLGFRHRGTGWPVYVDNLVVRELSD